MLSPGACSARIRSASPIFADPARRATRSSIAMIAAAADAPIRAAPSPRRHAGAGPAPSRPTAAAAARSPPRPAPAGPPHRSSCRGRRDQDGRVAVPLRLGETVGSEIGPRPACDLRGDLRMIRLQHPARRPEGIVHGDQPRPLGALDAAGRPHLAGRRSPPRAGHPSEKSYSEATRSLRHSSKICSGRAVPTGRTVLWRKRR